MSHNIEAQNLLGNYEIQPLYCKIIYKKTKKYYCKLIQKEYKQNQQVEFILKPTGFNVNDFN